MFVSFAYFYNDIAKAQDNIELFAEENTVWSVGKFNAPYQLVKKDFLWLHGNTQIDEVNYHIIRISSEYPPDMENSEIACYVKIFEDSVLYIRSLNEVENPIFDYKLKAGEEANLYGFNYSTEEFFPVSLYVEDTGMVSTMSGLRKYWDVSWNTGTRWIKGLGNEEGLIYANYAVQGFIGEENLMICAFDQYGQLYINPLFSNCYLTEVNYIKDALSVELYPNPCSGSFTIKSEHEIELVEIFDSTGLFLAKTKCSSPDSLVNVKSLAQGTYIVKITLNGQNKHFKLIVL